MSGSILQPDKTARDMMALVRILTIRSGSCLCLMPTIAILMSVRQAYPVPVTRVVMVAL